MSDANARPETPAARPPASALDEVRGEGPLPADTNRRDFLKLAGFSIAAAALPGCSRGETHRAVPFLDKPEDVTPGRATWFATTCRACEAGCGALAKYRDGRPIKLEGNPEHPLSRGGLCAAGQASLLPLYDSQRLRSPWSAGSASSWANVDAAIGEKLDAIRRSGGAVRVLTGTLSGPTALRAIETFLGTFQDGKHVMYDALSCSAVLDAHAEVFGRRLLPHYEFDKARVIVSFDADFLGTWISPVEFTRAWRAGRSLEDGGAHHAEHVQVESRLSLTGCSADRRLVVDAGTTGALLTNLAVRLARRAGRPEPWPAVKDPGLPREAVERLAKRLWDAPRGETLVVCGSNRVEDQKLTIWINELLGNHGSTIDLEQPSHQCLGDDRALGDLLAEIAAGTVRALVVAGCNPVYDLPGGEALAAQLAKLDLVVSLAGHLDETAAAAHFVCPDHHALEAWADAEPLAGEISVSQPVVRSLHDTRALATSLTTWAGTPRSDYDFMRETWKAQVFPRQHAIGAFELFWSRAVHDGFARVAAAPGAEPGPYDGASIAAAQAPAARPEGALGLVLYPKVSMRDGRHGHNPWLHELPDPVSKVSWDNYAALHPETAGRLGVRQGDVVEVVAETQTLRLPVLLQPGQHPGVVAVALGYGRAGTGRFHDVGPDWIEARETVKPDGVVGTNAAPLLRFEAGRLAAAGAAVTVRATTRRHKLACTQSHHSLTVPAHLGKPGEGPRPIAQEATLDAWRADPAAGAAHVHPFEELWPDDHAYEGHHWGMAIDLSACTGCSACVIGCQAENNIPVVGKDEVGRKRDMAWLRIDRYYAGEGTDVDVIHQPMLCQQCDNAPCESVCPVLATAHSSEGLNQQVYNRCVGTRYCSNNCPYKVRRFNWFDYAHDDALENLVLNPDVTVRSRGVMEKCSFCVQRIQEAKSEAKRTGRLLAEGDIQPACQQSCPAGAIVFGCTNDKASAVSRQAADPRSFRVLEELNVRPSVHYMRRIRNRPGEEVRHG